ncbi:MAG: rRNA pseudouridine synthase [Clostridiales bacterium]|nr:rRNA pseudouridine synthase [Clostridiales bacterium]
MRLQKYIASCGVTSRRKAEEMIRAGRVKVNGIKIDQMGYIVNNDDVVELDGKKISIDEKLVYIALNKPVGYITSVSDEQQRPTVMDLLSDLEFRVFPVGRLDFNTSGLLLLTNDGQMSYKLTHPSHKIYKTYRVKASGILSQQDIERLKKGVDIGGYITAKAYVMVEGFKDNCTIVEIKIFEGKNRQVRRMFKSIGHKVLELERIAIGDIQLGKLKRGHYRKLTKKEIEYLKRL